MTFPGIENDPTAPQVNQDLLAVEKRRKEREAEYGEYVAVQDIPWGTVLAATPGTAVPKSTVERLRWDELGLVAKRTSKAGREVLERTNTATTEERERWAAEDKAAAGQKTTAAGTPASARTTTARRSRAASAKPDASAATDGQDKPADTAAAPAAATDTATEGGAS